MTSERQPSHMAASVALLRGIIDSTDPDVTRSEKISASKELRILLGGEDLQGTGPGSMSREELYAEMHRVRALIDGYAIEKARPSSP